MTAPELAEFVARVRKLFRGEMDEDIFALAKSRIAGLRLAVCMNALDQYALQYGGLRGRFIPAKYFEIYGKLTIENDDREQSARRVASSFDRALALDVEAATVAADWAARRAEIDRAEPQLVAEILAALQRVGWERAPDSRDDWSRAYLIAVSDLATNRNRTDLAGIECSASVWYSSRVSAPPKRGQIVDK